MRMTRALAEAVTARLESSRLLADWGRAVTRVVGRILPQGPVKDLLAGTWLAHPVHPMLTDVTIGAWTSASLLDLLGNERVDPATNMLLAAGLISAVPTAVTGLADFSDVTTREDRATGAVHALGNVSALLLYAGSLAARVAGRRRSAAALSGLGLATMTGAGFLGGHLAYRRGVGVDQTIFQPPVRDWTEALPSDDLPDGEPRRVTVSGTNLLLYRSGDRIHALANRCSHRGGPLHKGSIEDGRATCPWHYSQFSLEDGQVTRGPATAPQPIYETRVQDGVVEVRSR